MVKENPNYTEAFQELQTIVQKMEDANISVDELTQNIERATFLINICKNKLTKTEEEVNKIIEKNND
ncbi:MAG: exodeoxyribonuclease VII small subunit [Bacteroidales bacterium]|jgi:exodeoxyribonuclease VII small subunit|nr:exodeoxyribonuclease VII small subunit [Bacteroidales bacterium]